MLSNYLLVGGVVQAYRHSGDIFNSAHALSTLTLYSTQWSAHVMSFYAQLQYSSTPHDIVHNSMCYESPLAGDLIAPCGSPPLPFHATTDEIKVFFLMGDKSVFARDCSTNIGNQ